jgi:hypothetical protein
MVFGQNVTEILYFEAKDEPAKMNGVNKSQQINITAICKSS